MRIQTFVIAALLYAFASTAVAADAHKLAIHVDQNDPAVMNMALNNAQNVINYYQGKGETVDVELVAYGPGLNMLVAGKSPVADRISAMALGNKNLSFSACGNTHKAMSKKAGKEVVLLDEATITPSGVVRLMELQEQGYSYVRP